MRLSDFLDKYNIELPEDSQYSQSRLIISREAYEKLSIIQKINLPDNVQPELTAAQKAYHQKVLSGELSMDAPYPDEEEFTDAEIKQAIEEHGSLFYNWSESELKDMAIRTEPAGQTFMNLTEEQHKRELELLYS